MINCPRPSNRSSRLTLPLGPSNSYFFSTAVQGIRRRSAARASRERVKAFSFTRSCCRAVSHSCCDTIGGGFIARCPFARSLFVDIFISPFFLDGETFTRNAARPPVGTAPATTIPMGTKQNGHIVYLLGGQLDR